MKTDQHPQGSAPLFWDEFDAGTFLLFNKYRTDSRSLDKTVLPLPEETPGWRQPKKAASEFKPVPARSLEAFFVGSLESFRNLAIVNPKCGEASPQLFHWAFRDPAHLRRIARAMVTRVESGSRRHLRGLGKIKRKVLPLLDTLPSLGTEDLATGKPRKQRYREILSEYLSSPWPNHRGLSDGPVAISPLLVESLVWKVQASLRLLVDLAADRNADALQALAPMVTSLVKKMNDHARRNPALFGDAPKKLPFWPVLKSEHLDFDEDHRSLLKSLGVGRHFPLTIAEGARWSARDTVGQWAIHLCQEIDILREVHLVNEVSEAWEHLLVGLPPFSIETWPNWWRVAQRLLKREYIDVVLIPELNATVTSPRDRKTPGLIRKRILQALKEKFKSMVGENKF